MLNTGASNRKYSSLQKDKNFIDNFGRRFRKSQNTHTFIDQVENRLEFLEFDVDFRLNAVDRMRNVTGKILRLHS